MKTRLRVLRAEKEWSQEELATKVGVTRQTINAIETGKYEASQSLALKLAHLFGMHVEDSFYSRTRSYQDRSSMTSCSERGNSGRRDPNR